MGIKGKKFTIEDVLEKIELCKSVHNNKYSYDNVKYVNYDTNVIITCPEHGDFEQNLYHHSKGHGCLDCRAVNMSKMMRKGKEDFVNKSNIVHKFKYTYDNVPDSFRVRSKVIITCPKHGDFKQTADSHKRGCGCPYCAGKSGEDTKKNIKIKKEKVVKILKIRELDTVKLVSIPTKKKERPLKKEKYVFHCEIHGRIEKNKSQIYKGQICGECRKIENRKNLFNKELNKMKELHNNRFEYPDYIDLVGVKTKITIRCIEHDYTFKYFKSVHTQTKYGGCIHCLKQYKNFGIKEQDQLIEQFKSVHGNRYGYNNVIYQNSNIKVSITCHKHGDFEQTTGSHLSGSGCPKCKHSSGEKLIQSLLKKMEIKYTSEKSFYGCKNDKTGKLLPFDIYVPEFHTCIEFDGHQHFIPVERWGGEDSLKEVQYRDNIKDVYCKNNDINLIRIPYTMGKIEIVDVLNKNFNKNLIVDIKKKTKWIEINIRDRIKDYKTREEFRINDNALWRYCYKHKLLDEVCNHMVKQIRYTYEMAKEICLQYINYTQFENERSGLINFIRTNKFFELVEHMDKRKVYWTDDEIINGLEKYEFKMDVRKNDLPLYSIALKRGFINRLKDKTIWWTEQMVRETFKKCRTKTELKKLYRGAENYAKKHGLYDELSRHFVNKVV